MQKYFKNLRIQYIQRFSFFHRMQWFFSEWYLLPFLNEISPYESRWDKEMEFFSVNIGLKGTHTPSRTEKSKN